MTTTEHLARIRAHCVELLAIAEKRTQGKWLADNRSGCCATYPTNRADETNGCHSDHDRNIHYSSRGASCEEGPTGGWTMDEQAQRNNTFIASCAGPAEAGWRATIELIDWSDVAGGSLGGEMQKDILAAWPEGLIDEGHK